MSLRKNVQYCILLQLYYAFCFNMERVKLYAREHQNLRYDPTLSYIPKHNIGLTLTFNNLNECTPYLYDLILQFWIVM